MLQRMLRPIKHISNISQGSVISRVKSWKSLNSKIPVEVLSESGSVLFHGYIVKESQSTLVVKRDIVHIPSTIVVGKNISLLAYDIANEAVRIEGSIRRVFYNKVTITGWTISHEYIGHTSKLLPKGLEGFLYPLYDKRNSVPLHCIVQDITEKTVIISTRECIATGDELRLVTRVAKVLSPLSVPCQVVRAVSKDGEIIRCKLEFLPMTAEESYILRAVLWAVHNRICVVE